MRGVYKDRAHAGAVLAEELKSYAGSRATILAIPNGGVAVAVPMAKKLGLGLDLIIVRKIPIPTSPEAGFGSVASDGTVFLNKRLLNRLSLPSQEVDRLAGQVLEEIRRRMELYGVQGNYQAVKGGTAILVDDGLASGLTMEAAVHVVKKYEPKEIVVAVPTASRSAFNRISPLVTRLVCPQVRDSFYFAVADAYERWYDLEAEEVISLLADV